ncbi:hypothetical protein I8J29_27985, partial [Paenibacillus sp. MWE-103]
MNVTVYAAATPAGSWAGWTIAPEVDFAYWLDAGYRAEAERAAMRWDCERRGAEASWAPDEAGGRAAASGIREKQGAGDAPDGRFGAEEASLGTSEAERAAMRRGKEKRSEEGTPVGRFGGASLGTSEAERAAMRRDKEKQSEDGTPMDRFGGASLGTSEAERAAMRQDKEKQSEDGTPMGRFGDGTVHRARSEAERAGEGEGGRPGDAMGGETVRLVAWPVPLPLGHALQVAARWPGGRLAGGRLEAALSRLV